MVAEPAAPSVQRNQEQTRGLQPGQLGLRTGLTEDRVAQGGTHLVDDRCPAQEPLHTVGELSQRLAVEVVGDEAVITGDRQDIAVAVPGDRCGEVEAGGPTLGAYGHRRGFLRRDLHVGLGEDLPRPGGIEGQVTGHELHGVPRGPQPGQVRLLETTRGHQLGTVRYASHHHAQDIVAVRRPELVQVVEEQDERDGTGAERGGHAGRRPTQGRYPEPGHVGRQILLTRDLPVRGSQQGQQRRRVVVQAIQRHPPDTPIIHLRPLGQQGRLAVAGGGRDAHDASRAGAGRLDQIGATDRSRPAARHREPGFEQRGLEHLGLEPGSGRPGGDPII